MLQSRWEAKYRLPHVIELNELNVQINKNNIQFNKLAREKKTLMADLTTDTTLANSDLICEIGLKLKQVKKTLDVVDNTLKVLVSKRTTLRKNKLRPLCKKILKETGSHSRLECIEYDSDLNEDSDCYASEYCILCGETAGDAYIDELVTYNNESPIDTHTLLTTQYTKVLADNMEDKFIEDTGTIDDCGTIDNDDYSSSSSSPSSPSSIDLTEDEHSQSDNGSI